MKVEIPKRKKLVNFFEGFIGEKVNESKEAITYEISFDVTLRFSTFDVRRGEKTNFYEQIGVEGGKKTKYPDRIEITTSKSEELHVMISKEIRCLIDKYVEEHKTSVSNFVRMAIESEIFDWLKSEQKPKKNEEESTREYERMFG